MAADDNAKHRAADATVLLTGGHVDELIAALRGVNTVLVRVDASNRDLIKSNRELVDELRKGRRQGKKDRREKG